MNALIPECRVLALTYTPRYQQEGCDYSTAVNVCVIRSC